jgi:hypothetical protein
MAETKGKVVKSVAFQLQDPFEFELYYFMNRHKYFSTAVKRLIQRDMETNMHDFDREACQKAYRDYMDALEAEKRND